MLWSSPLLVGELCHVKLFKFQLIFVCSDIAEYVECVGPYHVESTTEVQDLATLVRTWMVDSLGICAAVKLTA